MPQTDAKEVCMIAPEGLPVPPIEGGAIETWIHETSRHMARDCALLLISTRHQALPAEESHDGITHIRIARGRTGWMNRKASRAVLRTSRRVLRCKPVVFPLRDHEYALRAAKVAAEYKPDIIYVHNRPQFLPLIRPRNPKAKMVAHIHNPMFSPQDTGLLEGAYRDIFRKLDLVICVSRYVERELLRCFDITGKTRVVYNGVNLKAFDIGGRKELELEQLQTAKDEEVISYFGRLMPQKGPQILIDAIPIITEQFPGAKFLFVGPATFRQKESSFSQRLLSRGESHGAILTGFLKREDVVRIFLRSDIVVVPSIGQDPSPLVCYEAQASKAGLVATKVGGIPELLLRGKTGLLVDPNSPESLANAMLELLSDRNTLRKMASRARKWAERRFPWEMVACRTLEVLRSLDTGLG